MSKVYYNKLIRDKIPDKIKKKGEACEVREISNDEEYEQELLKKISEEASSLSRVRSREEFLDEYTDLIVVLNTIISLQKFSESDVKKALENNLEKKGGFEKRHFLHWSEDSDYKSNETPQGLKE
jgi:predicted house-cleaning noncanonical NTP pyrophosphatase (MazG superfamily)